MANVKAIPENYHTLTPYLCVYDATRALDFYKRALGATEIMRHPTPDGKIAHAELKIGDSMFMLSDEMPGGACQSPQSLGGTPVSIWIYTEDVDSLFNRAVQAGATVKMPRGGHVLGRPMGPARRSVRSLLVARNSQGRCRAGRDAEAGAGGDGQDGSARSESQVLRAREAGWIQWI